MIDESKIRVTVSMKKAVMDVLSRAAEFTNPDAFAEELASAVLTAEDDKTRYCVITQNPLKEVYVFGPYASHDTAHKAISSGNLASMEKTTGGVYPLIVAPKKPTKTTTTTKRKKG